MNCLFLVRLLLVAASIASESKGTSNGENSDLHSIMDCTDAGDAMIERISISNPLNNSYVPTYLYLRFAATVYDEKSFVSLISNGEIDLCISNERYKRCGLNVLEEIRLDPFDYIGAIDDSTDRDRDEGSHGSTAFRDFQLQFDLRSSFHSSNLCTANLRLKCCIGDDFFKKKSQSKNNELLKNYSLHIDSIVANEAIFSSRRPPPWSYCRQEKIEYVIGIKSWALNFQQRDAIRNSYLVENTEASTEAYGTEKRCAKFIVGTVEEKDDPNAARINFLLQMEQAVYGDLLLNEQIPGIVDSYHNLFAKVLAFLRWLPFSDPPRHVVITDDDVYINISDLTSFLSLAPHSSLYTGEAIYHRKPMRDVNHANYLSVDDWPDDELIPFIAGNFYILSGDAVSLFTNNLDMITNRIKFVGDLEDVSVAAWLRSVNIYPTHLSSVLQLKSNIRRRDVVNIPPRFLALFDVKTHSHFKDIHNFVVLSQNVKKYDYDESRGSEYFVFVSPQSLYAIMFINQLLQYRNPEGKFYYHTLDVDSWENLDPSKMKVDFLIVSPNDAVVDANDSTIDSFDSKRLFALQYIVQKFDAKQVILISGKALDLTGIESMKRNEKDSIVDLLITTVTDEGYLPNWSNQGSLPHDSSPICKRTDCWNLRSYNIFYVPVISVAFSEMAAYDSSHYVRHLLHSRGLEWAINTNNQKLENNDIAYLYHRCTGLLREKRESFYQILKKRLSNSTHALGKCGSIGKDSHDFHTGRFSRKYLDEAIDIFKSYKFVVAFENSITSGYVTEKIALAYLAGAVPIYFGTTDIGNYFNMGSMIHCGKFLSLEECANFVLEVNDDDELYLQILAEPPVLSGSQFHDLFSWII